MQRSPLLIILLTVFIALVGFGIVIPLLPIYATHFGANGRTIGLLQATYSAMQFLLAPTMGRLSDRLGRRPVLLGALGLTVASYGLLAFAHNLPMLFLSRMLAGIGGADITVAQAYIADVTPPENRTKGMGLFGAAFGFGFMIGPPLGAVLATMGTAAPPLAAAGFALATLVFALFALPEPVKHVQENPRPRSLGVLRTLTASSLAIAALYFLSVLLQGQLQTTFVIFTHARFEWDQRQNGYFLGMIGLVAVLVQGGFMGPLSRRFGQRMLVPVGLLLIGIGMYLIAGAHSLTPMISGGVLDAIGFSLVLPSLSSLASLTASAGEQGQVMGVFQSCGSLARIMAPLVGGTLFDLSPSTPLLTGAALALVTALAAWPMLRRGIHREPAPQ